MAFNLLTAMVGHVLRLIDHSLLVHIVQIGTERRDPHIDSIDITTLVFLLEFNARQRSPF